MARERHRLVEERADVDVAFAFEEHQEEGCIYI